MTSSNNLYQLALHIFRRDLRLPDNTALIEALENANEVIPCFIFDPRQIENNIYKSNACMHFMVNSLNDLDEALKKYGSRLYMFYGEAETVIDTLLQHHPIDAVYINRDYTPFSITRDQKIKSVCDKHKIIFHSYADALLHEPEQVLKKDKTPYTVFTAEFRQASVLPVSIPIKNVGKNYYRGELKTENRQPFTSLATIQMPDLFVKGGRREGLQLLKQISRLTNYADTRNLPALNGTTGLSAHNKFGTLSIREVYAYVVATFGTHHSLINELYWRDFFTHIGFHFPKVFSEPFHQKYSSIQWQNNPQHFQAWCEGKTGFPIVDAGMRQLNATGYMHNRVRMIVASFLTKDLHIDWRLGEKYFAQQLVDYDPAVNNGNWQWAASTGCDAQPYFRIFNPWLQQEKYDADCIYIKRWIPELADLPVKTIHKWYQNQLPLFCTYPLPIIDHAIEAQKAKILYQQAATKK